MKIKLLESRIAVCLFTAALTAGFASGCAPKAAAGAKKAATAAAHKWLGEIDNGQYAQSWQDASVDFQRKVTEGQWKSALAAVRQPIGAVVSRNLKSAQYATQLPGAPSGQYVVMQFDTSFAHKKSTTETVTFTQGKDGQWKADGYFIK